MKYTKNVLISALCIITALSISACGKKDDSHKQNAPIDSIPTATANNTKTEESIPDSNDLDNSEENSNKSDKSDSAAKDRTPQSDNNEIENNIRDAQELIDNDCYDDAKAIIKALRSRNLSDEQTKKVDELEAQLISISD